MSISGHPNIMRGAWNSLDAVVGLPSSTESSRTIGFARIIGMAVPRTLWPSKCKSRLRHKLCPALLRTSGAGRHNLRL